MKYYSWNRTCILTSTLPLYYTSSVEIERQLVASGMDAERLAPFANATLQTNAILQMLTRQPWRILLVMAMPPDLQTVAEHALKLQMSTAGWVFITTLVVSTPDDAEALNGWLTLLPFSANLHRFAKEVADYSRMGADYSDSPQYPQFDDYPQVGLTTSVRVCVRSGVACVACVRASVCKCMRLHVQRRAI